MRKLVALLAVAFFAVSVAPAVAGTPEEAKVLAVKAAKLIAAEGESAFPKLGDPAGGYVEGDLFVTVIDRKGVVRASAMAKLVGLNMWEATDPDGVKINQVAWKAVEGTDGAWSTYKFTNPATKKIEPKKSWVQKVGDYIVVCGAYIH